jgi:hypothetical protein
MSKESIFEGLDITALGTNNDALIDLSNTEGTTTNTSTSEEGKEEVAGNLIDISALGTISNEDETTKTTTSNITDSDDTTEDSVDTEETVDADSSGELFKAFGSTLVEKGVFSEELFKDFDGTIDGLVTAVDREIGYGIESYKESLPDILKELIDNYEEGVPLDQLISTKSREISFNNITDSKLEEDTNLQKEIVRQYLESTGLKENKINKLIETYEDTDELFSEAKDALGEIKDLLKKEEAYIKKQQEQERKVAEQRTKELLNTVETTISKTEEIVPGIKLNDKVRKEIYSSMTQPTGRDAEGNPVNKVMEIRAKDPIKFEMTLHYLASLGIFEGKWDKVISTAKTSSVKELEKLIKSNDNKFSGSGKASIPASKSSADLLSAIKNKYSK